MTQITRRKFIGTTAAGAAGFYIATATGIQPAWASAWSPYQPDPPQFPQGVASGDPVADGVVLWTRVAASGPVTVGWEISDSPLFGAGQIVASGSFDTDASRDHTVKVDVSGLAAGRTYYYRFSDGSTHSRVGRTKTAPATGSTSALAFALVSCQNWVAGYYAAFRHIAARADLDFVLHVGDYIYEYGNSGVRTHEPTREIVTVADYRERYRQYRSDADLRAAHAAHPFILTFDDHEVANNSWREGAQNHQPSEGDYTERRNRAYQVYDEYMPIRLPDGRGPDGMRVYRRLGYGSLLDVLMLDTRQYRDQEVASPAPVPGPQTNPDNGADGRTFMGAEQKEWLEQELTGSTAQWRVLGNQAMLAQFTYGVWPDEVGGAIQELTGMPPDGYTVNPDQWDGYQAEQKEFLRFLQQASIDNTLVCTGDIHMSFANEVYADEGRFRVEKPVAAEFVGPSITSNNFDESVGAPPRTLSLGVEQAVKASNPHIRYVEMDSNGYVVVRVNSSEAVGEWYHLTGPRGANAAHDPNAGERLATAWKVDDGDLTLKWVGGDPIAV